MTKEIKNFFDRHADKWDTYEKPDIGLIIDKILDRICISIDDRIFSIVSP